MKDFTAIVGAPVSQIKDSLKSIQTSVKKIHSISEERLSKWRIGRRNFP